MSIITTTKRKRKNITAKMCEAKVAKQTKTTDARVGGLYVSVTPKGVAVFNLKFTCPILGKRRTIKIGVYHREIFNVEHARTEAMLLKAKIGRGEDVAQTARQAKAQQAKLSGVTVDQIIDERIAWVSQLVPKGRDKDGIKLKMGPRKKSWAGTADHLNRFVRPRLGRMIASEVTKHDIAQLQADILAGTLIIKKGQDQQEGLDLQRPPHAQGGVGAVQLGG